MPPAEQPDLLAPCDEGTLALSPEAIRKACSGAGHGAEMEVTNYAVRGEIARGAMGSIREADDLKLQRTVAMKVMLAASRTSSMRARFAHEATVLAKLAHPNIVPVHDLGQDSEGQPYYTMKLVKGLTLQTILNELRNGVAGGAKQFTLDRLLTIFRKVCDAMAFAHSQRILHRDLKPENIMVGEFGEVLVMDWGLAKLLDAETHGQEDGEISAPDFSASPGLPLSLSSQTLDGSILGTPQYMSPEQADGRVTELDERSDIYSLGGILYAILTLRPPVKGKTLQEVLEKVTTGGITPPSTFGAMTSKGNPGVKGDVLEAKKIKPLPHCPGGRVPAALSSVAMKALALDKTKRYPDVTALGADIEAYQGGFATSAEGAGTMKQLGLLIKRHKAVSIALLVLLLVGAAFVTNVIVSRHRMAVTLAELRGTAPTFMAQATALVEAGKFDEAMGKIGYAVQLDPKNPAYRLQRAHLLEAGQHLADAVTAYREVLALDPDNHSAKDNLSLCERLQEENGGAPQLRREFQLQLVDALLHENRAVEAGPLAAQLGVGGAALEATLHARLKEYTAQPGWWNSRALMLPNGTFQVDLEHLKLGDLTIFKGLPISDFNLKFTDLKDLRAVALAGLPLTVLNIEATRVTDLSPLGGLKLEGFYGPMCGIADIEPLRGMPLRRLDLNRTQVTDLSILTGMPLEDLNLGGLTIKSLMPLRGLPLKHLSMVGAQGDLDMVNLVDCRELEDIALSKRAANIETLRTLPKLTRLRMEGDQNQNALVPAEKFWDEFKPAMEAAGTIRLALNKAGISLGVISAVTPLADGSVDVNLSNTPLSDLDFLRGLPVSRLNIYNTKVHDLAPLRGSPLKKLGASDTAITDLEALRGMPLIEIELGHVPVTSVLPLQGCPTLEVVQLPRSARDVESLRHLPKLHLISYQLNMQTNLPDKTPEQFWKEYDAQQTAGKK